MNISVPYDTYFPSRHSSSVLYAETSVDRLFLSVESPQRENAHTSYLYDYCSVPLILTWVWNYTNHRYHRVVGGVRRR